MAIAILYGTEYCHLCEEAQIMLKAKNIDFQNIDISDSQELMERYQFRIPVLQYNGVEVDWPFEGKI